MIEHRRRPIYSMEKTFRVVLTREELKSIAAVYNVDQNLTIRQIPMLEQHTRVVYEKDPYFPAYVPKEITTDHLVFTSREELIDAIDKEAYRQWKER